LEIEKQSGRGGDDYAPSLPLPFLSSAFPFSHFPFDPMGGEEISGYHLSENTKKTTTGNG